MFRLKQEPQTLGRRTVVSHQAYFFLNQFTKKKSFRIAKMIFLALVLFLLVPMSVFAAAPVFIQNGPFSITENSSTGTYVGQVVATDATSFAITAGNGTGGGAFSIDNSGIIRVADGTQLNYESTQQFSLTVDATNVDGTTSATVIINIVNVNDPPQMGAPSYDFTINENESNGSLVGQVSATDPDPGDTLVYTILLANPSGVFSMDSDDGEIRIADTNQIDFESGTTEYTIFVQASDGGLLTVVPVTITIDDANDAPEAVDDGPYNATEDTDLVVDVVGEGVLANDTDQDQDPADTVTAVLDTQPANGTVDLNANGTFTYTPNAQFDGTDTFTYHATDGTADSNTATVTIEVAGTNDAPTANNDTYSTSEDAVLTVTLPENGVLENDTDPEDDTLNVTDFDATSVMGAAVSVDSDGTFSYDPTGATAIQALDDGDNTTDSFTYTISDGDADDTATVTINLSGLNDAPNAVDDGFTLDENTTNNTLTVRGNDTDPDASASLTITAVDPTTSQGGAATTDGSTVSYTPLTNFDGTDTFTYTISDGVLTDTATVSITVRNLNTPPVINQSSPQSISVDEDGSTLASPLNLTATESDVGDSLTWSIYDQGNIGAASFSGGNTGTSVNVYYVPNANMNGSDSFVVRVSDNNGGTADVTVNVTVNEVNDPPTANDDYPSVNEQTSSNTLYPLANDTISPDTGETLSILAVGAASNGGSVTINGTSLVYTPTTTFIGTETFTYTISDGRTGTDTATVHVTVNNVNFAPQITEGISTDVTMDEDGSPTPFSLTLHATDADNDTLTWSVQTPASYGVALVSGTGSTKTVNYTPPANYYGIDSFRVRVTDGVAADSILVVVTINPINDAPNAVNDTRATPPDTAVTITVLANDTDPENDTLAVTAVTQGSKGTVTHNGTTVTYTPDANQSGSDSFTYTISDGHGGSDTATVTIQLGMFEIFLPVVLNNFVSAPDLVVTNVSASSTLIEVTIENQGTMATSSGFWVDFYIDPDPVPTHENEVWSDVADEGIVWGVNVAIAAGESLTLRYSTAPGAPNLYYSAVNSSYSGLLPVGTPVYAQVDSAHLNTTYGGVLEIHEILGTTYNNVSSAYMAVAPTAAVFQPAFGQVTQEQLVLPLRPEPN